MKAPKMTFVDRAERQRRVAAAIASVKSSRQVAREFGMHDSYVRSIARLYGVSHPRGWRPA